MRRRNAAGAARVRATDALGLDPDPSAADRRASLVSRTLTGPRTRVSLLAAVVLALVATLVGPMGRVQSASANDGNPTFRVGTDDGWDYVQFINAVRARVNDGRTTYVQGAGNAYQVDHTDTHLYPGSSFPANRNRHDAYLQVDIQMWGNPNFVRLQLQRADLYILGWWDHNNVYRYLGSRDRTIPREERERMQGGHMVNAASVARTGFDENYVSMQNTARELRANMAISRDSISNAAWYLWYSSNMQEMARGALRLAQFISEAARQRPIRDGISLIMGNNGYYSMPPQFVEQQNNWGRLSGRFNWLLARDAGYRDPQPITAYRAGAFGTAVAIVLYTAAQYAQYVLATSKGR